MIHVENLTKYYNDFCAVDQINLDIQGGEILGLLGPNGAGKTTTLRMLTGYFMPTSGNIHIKDYSIYENLVEIKKLIGYLPESAPLYYNMLVYDYLDYIARIRGFDTKEKNKRIRYLVDICGLNGIMHNTINELSKGLKQRVGLAHAMMSDPEILVLDEPTSGLDPNQLVEIRNLVSSIGKEKTVLLSTHILQEVEAICDRVIIINNGGIVADDDAQRLKEKGAGLTQTIHIELDEVTKPEIWKKLLFIDHVKSIGNNQFLLETRELRDIRGDIFNFAVSQGLTILSLSLKKKSLEEVFRELTSQ
ncbi:MAG: ATP-binding cassette domain-containing protein [Cyclobacteriaceae bacterium]|nr:ATP-binding cassette domain-containing protein [Cyclobacteriaceae bacterium]